MAKYTLTDQELRDRLHEQLAFLRASANGYDNGVEGEAKRLATTIRVLVHDDPKNKQAKSLLLLLNIKDKLRIHNTAHPFDPEKPSPHQGLVVMRMEVPEGQSASVIFTLVGPDEPFTATPPKTPVVEVTYVPRVMGPPSRLQPTIVPFSQWWEEIVIKDKAGTVFSRKDLVLAMANKEGGAHVAPQLNTQYANLTRFHSQGWRVKTGGMLLPPNNSLVAASIRQIAHELLISIENSFPAA